MTTKESSRRQIVILIKIENIANFIVKSSSYIFNINRTLKDIKSDVIADFIHIDQQGLIVTTNKVVNNFNLTTIKKYVKNINNINSNKVLSSKLP